MIDTTDGSSTQLGTALGASGNLALSPSDVVTHLFGSTGTALVRIAVATGEATTINSNIAFNVYSL
jgi:uncharacterized membrane protein YuzA (DUF378 family)